MEIYLNNKKINVIVTRKKIKNIYFRFDENLNLIISANNYINEKEILNLINKNILPLTKMLEKAIKKEQIKREFWYLGNKYDIIYKEEAKDVYFEDNKIICKDENMLNRFLKKQTEKTFTEEVLKLKEIIKTPYFTLKIRQMKTRWGVCNYKLNTITLNSELIRHKKEHLRYVIVHEMCHFYHHNHSASFWAVVNNYYPDYNKIRKELRNYEN